MPLTCLDGGSRIVAHMGGLGGHGERSYGAVTSDWTSQLGQSVSPFQAWDAPPSDDTVMTVHMHRASTPGVQGTHRNRQTKTTIFWALHFLRVFAWYKVGLPHHVAGPSAEAPYILGGVWLF